MHRHLLIVIMMTVDNAPLYSYNDDFVDNAPFCPYNDDFVDNAPFCPYNDDFVDNAPLFWFGLLITIFL